MKLGIYQALNIEDEERHSVTLLGIQSVFLGIFYGLFDISAHTLFLSEYSEEMIAQAYTLSGVVGIVMTAVYSKFQQIVKFGRLAVVTLWVLAVITAGIWFGFSIKYSRELVFISFMFLGPLNIVAIVNFWGVAGRIYSLRQGKRLFGLIGSGQVFGIITASYMIPFLPLLKINLGTTDLILVSAIGLLVASIFQFFVSRRFSLEGVAKQAKEKSISWKQMLTNKYILAMSGFVGFSMMVLFFVSYLFLSIAKQQYPEETDLKNFLGVFTGTLMIFGFLIKTFVYSKLMKSYGLKTAMMILPFLLLALSVGSLLISFFSANAVLYLFLIISMARLFSLSLRDAIEIPAFKTLYQSLPINIRFDVQSRIDGTINELSALASGLALLLLSSFFGFVYFIYVLIILLITWLVILVSVYKEYKLSLQKALSDSQAKGTPVRGSTQIDANFVPDRNELLQVRLYSALKPIEFETWIVNCKPEANSILEVYAIKEIERRIILSGTDWLYEKLTEVSDQQFAEEIDTYLGQLAHILNQYHEMEQIMSISRARNRKNRLIAARIIGFESDEKYLPSLILLLRDLNDQVRNLATIAAQNFNRPEIIQILFDEMQRGKRKAHIFPVLISFQEKTISQLRQNFFKTGVSIRNQIDIVRIIGAIPSDTSVQFLIDKITFPIRKIAEEAIIILVKRNIIVPQHHFRLVQQALELSVNIQAWNIAALWRAEQEYESELLLDAIKQNMKDEYSMIFNLLSLLYTAEKMAQIRYNIESSTSEGVGFALELLDLFIAEELKPIIFALFEDNTTELKIRMLQEHFPISVTDDVDLLESIINRDLNYTSIWLKIIALQMYSDTGKETRNQSVVAHLFNPELHLREMALSITLHTNPSLVNEVLSRVAPEELDWYKTKIKQLNKYPKSNVYELILLLKSKEEFKDLDFADIISITSNLRFISLRDNLFTPFDDKATGTLIFLNNGSLHIKVDNVLEMQMQKGDLLFTACLYNPVSQGYTIFPGTDTDFFMLESGTWFEIVYDNLSFCKVMSNLKIFPPKNQLETV